MRVIDEIAAERRRQIAVEGWTPEHDDEHGNRQLAQAAACYVDNYIGREWLVSGFPDGEAHYRNEPPHDDWPWADEWWKPKTPRRDLIRAAALLVAEIERMDRMAPNSNSSAENAG